MTLNNQERALHCQQAIIAYSDDDSYTNLVDFLADALHWCHVNGHSFRDALDTALMHFDAEITGDDILDDFNHPATERNQPMKVKANNNEHNPRWEGRINVSVENYDREAAIEHFEEMAAHVEGDAVNSTTRATFDRASLRLVEPGETTAKDRRHS